MGRPRHAEPLPRITRLATACLRKAPNITNYDTPYRLLLISLCFKQRHSCPLIEKKRKCPLDDQHTLVPGMKMTVRG